MKYAIYHLENWSVITRGALYKAPEACVNCLSGRRVEDNKEVITSYIVDSHGLKVYTRSGSTYILGEIEPEYKQWCKENNIEINPDNPVKGIGNNV